MVRRGTQQQALEYACCEGAYLVKKGPPIAGPWMTGFPRQEGPSGRAAHNERENNPKRKIHDRVYEMVRAGRSNKEICLELQGSAIHFLKSMTALRETILTEDMRPNGVPPLIVYLWGDAGTGKSRIAHQLAHYLSGPLGYYKPPTGRSTWYADGYHGQGVVLFDEFSGSEMKPSLFKQLTDRYQINVNLCGRAAIPWAPSIIIFTSQRSPTGLWPKALTDADKRAVLRRIHWCQYFPKIRNAMEGRDVRVPELFNGPRMVQERLNAPPPAYRPVAVPPVAVPYPGAVAVSKSPYVVDLTGADEEFVEPTQQIDRDMWEMPMPTVYSRCERCGFYVCKCHSD